MREDIEFVVQQYKDADATQIAEVLWLSKFLPKGKEKKENAFKENAEPKDVIERLPKDVTHTIIISKGSKSLEKDVKSTKNYTPIRNKNSNSSYGVNLDSKPIFSPIKEQFSLLRVKQKRVSNKEIDEVKSAEYIANTGIFNPIFKLEKFYRPYFALNVLIDTNESMFLWEESIEYFIKELKHSYDFTEVTYIEFNSAKEQVELKNRRAKLGQSKTLNLVFADTVGKAWRNNQMFLLLDAFSKGSFTAIVSMLPKQMWQRTSLREGERRFMKNSKFPPNNRALKAEYAFIEEGFSKKNIKIPIIPFDDSAFEYLSKVLLATKGSLIETRVFEDLERIALDEVETELDAKTRVKRFFNSAQPQAKELAIYCSVLPLNKKIIKELIKLKGLGNIDAFAEFYFGGLLDKTLKTKLGTYEFYEGVQKELLQHISIEVAKELWEMLAEITAQSLGVRFGLIELLHEVQSGEPLDEKEQLLAKLLMDILAEKGRFYEKDIDRLRGLSGARVREDVVYLETNTYQMGSNEYSNEHPVHTITFDYNFAIAKTPVTFEEYDLYCEDTGAKKPSDEGWGRGKRPVINVTWEDANNYCKWLNKKLKIDEESKYRYRLPTEAEWEYACRAGTTTKWSFGDDEKELDKYAWYGRNDGDSTKRVGTKEPNQWGLYDMHGNVWEWCLDDWSENYNETPIDGSANHSQKEDKKSLRGGSWIDNASDSRSANRDRNNPTYRGNNVGFRLLRTLP